MGWFSIYCIICGCPGEAYFTCENNEDPKGYYEWLNKIREISEKKISSIGHCDDGYFICDSKSNSVESFGFGSKPSIIHDTCFQLLKLVIFDNNPYLTLKKNYNRYSQDLGIKKGCRGQWLHIKSNDAWILNDPNQFPKIDNRTLLNFENDKTDSFSLGDITLNSLPKEIVLKICNHLNLVDLCILMQVSKSWYLFIFREYNEQCENACKKWFFLPNSISIHNWVSFYKVCAFCAPMRNRHRIMTIINSIKN